MNTSSNVSELRADIKHDLRKLRPNEPAFSRKGEVKNICTNGVVWYSMQITNYTHGPNRPHSETQHSPCGHNFFTVSWITASRHIIRYAHGGIQVFKLFFGTHVLNIPVHIT